jgi:outer membrane protein OmpA-like peptidoglycan-associated protein
MKILPSFAVVVSLCALGAVGVAPHAAGQGHAKDFKGSSDHPLFPSRMPGYYINSYRQSAFDAVRLETRPVTTIEGKHTRISYYLDTGQPHPGALAVHRNYQNAIRAAGGEVLFSSESYTVMKATRDGTEVWAQVQAGRNRYIYLTVVERTPMTQVIKADAMAAALDKDGFIPLDIHFATGKADILPESLPTVDEIASLLKSQPALKVGVEGHTDDAGTPAGNKTLSEARARSVAAAIVAKGIDASRLFPVGHGQERPIADNRTEAGRATNRRVELVKRR